MDAEDFNMDLIERMLRFANLSEVKSAREVEAIFQDHPYAFLFPHMQDPGDVQGLIQLRDDLRGWLRIFAAGHSQDSIAVRDEMVRRYQEKATRTATIHYQTFDGRKHALPIELWGLPHLDFVRGELTIGVRPFLSGAESATYFAVIMLFASGKTSRVSICQAPLPQQKRVKEKQRCGKFFLKTEEHRATCSKECADLRRREQVSQSVIKFVEKQVKSSSRQKSKRAQPTKGRKKK